MVYKQSAQRPEHRFGRQKHGGDGGIAPFLTYDLQGIGNSRGHHTRVKYRPFAFRNGVKVYVLGEQCDNEGDKPAGEELDHRKSHGHRVADVSVNSEYLKCPEKRAREDKEISRRYLFSGHDPDEIQSHYRKKRADPHIKPGLFLEQDQRKNGNEHNVKARNKARFAAVFIDVYPHLLKRRRSEQKNARKHRGEHGTLYKRLCFVGGLALFKDQNNGDQRDAAYQKSYAVKGKGAESVLARSDLGGKRRSPYKRRAQKNDRRLYTHFFTHCFAPSVCSVGLKSRKPSPFVCRCSFSAIFALFALMGTGI